MIKRSFELTAFLSTLTLFIPSGSTAQDIPSSYRFVDTRQEAGLSFGPAFATAGQLGIGPTSGQLVSARYGVGFGGAIGIEFGGSMALSERDVRDVRRDEGDQFIGRTDIDIAAIDFRMKINLTGSRTWNHIQPFLLLGGGIAFQADSDLSIENAAELPEIDTYDFGTQFIATAGTGLSIYLSRRLSLRIDGVLNLWKVSTPDGYLDATRELPIDQTIIPDSEWVSIRSLTLGTSWHF